MLGFKSLLLVTDLDSDLEMLSSKDALGSPSDIQMKAVRGAPSALEEEASPARIGVLVRGGSSLGDLLDPEAFHPRYVWLLADLEQLGPNRASLRQDSMVVTVSEEGGEDGSSVHEWYALSGSGEVRRTELGTYHRAEADFVLMTDEFVWKRRRDLNGARLRYLVLPWTNVISVEEDAEALSTDGYFADVIDHLQTSLNFTLTLALPEDGLWGSSDGNGSWMGMVGELSRGEADVCCAMTISEEREGVMDFTLGVLDVFMTLIIHADYRQKLVIDSSAFIFVFTVGLWSAILVVMCATSSVQCVLDLGRHSSGWRIWSSLGEALGTFGRSLLQLGTYPPRACLSTRIMYFTVYSFGFFIFANYTSVLTSVMTTGPRVKSITSFQDLLENTDFKVMIMKGTSAHTTFSTAEPSSDVGKVYRNIMESQERNMKRSTQHLLDDLLNDEDSVAYADFLTFIHNDRLSVMYDFKEAVVSRTGLGLREQSDLRELFNYEILKMFESGLLQQYKFRLFGDKPPDYATRIFVDEASPIGYENMTFLILLLLSGIVFALLLSYVERVVWRLSQRDSS